MPATDAKKADGASTVILRISRPSSFYWMSRLCPLFVIHVDVDDVCDALPLQLVKLQKLMIVAAL